MINEKNISSRILIIDIALLMAVISGEYYFIQSFFPSITAGIPSLTSLLVTYFFSYVASYAFYPAIVQQRMVKSEQIARRVIATNLMILLMVSLATTLLHSFEHFPRTFLLVSVSTYSICLFAERMLIKKALGYARSHSKNTNNVVLVGNDPSILQLYNIFSVPSYGYNVIGTFYEGEAPSKEIENLRIGSSEDLYGWLAVNSNNVNEIYGYFPKEQKELVNMICKFCDNHLIRFFYVPALDIFNGSMAFSIIDKIPVVARRMEPLAYSKNKMIKRAFDILFSSIVLLTVFPLVLIFVSIMILIKNPGPIFFLQDRTGLDGKVFRCIKFRSMKVNDQADTLQATKDDPRKFPFGDFMRKTNIDELPQFINVFKGDMSIVGPRPHMLKHTEEYSKLINHFMVRHLAKPGITGLAQVSGFRGETKYIDQMEGRVKKDIEYIENWTFLLDLKIIIKTVTNVVFRQEKGNAY